MTQRDWIEKDFYRELGVASGASQDEIKKAYRKLARELHPDANPGDAKAEARFKSVSEAYGVLSDEKKRREYDETRALFAGGRWLPGRFPGRLPGGFPGGRFPGGGGQTFDMGDLFGNTGGAGPGLGDLLGGIFGGAGRRPRHAGVGDPRAARCGRRERAADRLHPGGPGCRGADPALGPRALPDVLRQRRAAGHHPAAVPDLLRAAAWSAATRARSRSPSRARTAAAPAGSSTTRAPSAAATASAPAPGR